MLLPERTIGAHFTSLHFRLSLIIAIAFHWTLDWTAEKWENAENPLGDRRQMPKWHQARQGSDSSCFLRISPLKHQTLDSNALQVINSLGLDNEIWDFSGENQRYNWWKFTRVPLEGWFFDHWEWFAANVAGGRISKSLNAASFS